MHQLSSWRPPVQSDRLKEGCPFYTLSSYSLAALKAKFNRWIYPFLAPKMLWGKNPIIWDAWGKSPSDS